MHSIMTRFRRSPSYSGDIRIISKISQIYIGIFRNSHVYKKFAMQIFYRQNLFFPLIAHNRSRLFHADHVAVYVDNHLEAHHAHISAAFFRDAGIEQVI